MKQAALLIKECDFDALVEAGVVKIIGSYIDLRQTFSENDPYVEYIIEPTKFSGINEVVDIVVIAQNDIDEILPRLIKYPTARRTITCS